VAKLSLMAALVGWIETSCPSYTVRRKIIVGRRPISDTVQYAFASLGHYLIIVKKF